METDPDGTQILMQLFILVLLTLVNAFFAGAEMAVVSVNKNRVKVLAEEGNKKTGYLIYSSQCSVQDRTVRYCRRRDSTMKS